MKSIRDIGSTKNKLRSKVIMFSLALGLLVVVSTNAISPLELVKPAMAAKKLISTDDIADNAVTSPKIKAGEVKTSDIADGTITGDDVSPSFMIRKTLNDDAAGHTHNWNPEGLSRHFSISDDDITGDENSLLISIMVQDPIGGTDPPVCSVRAIITVTGFWHFSCDHAPIDGSKLHYVITKLPPNVATSTTSASSTSSSTPTISSPFSSLGGH